MFFNGSIVKCAIILMLAIKFGAAKTANATEREDTIQDIFKFALDELSFEQLVAVDKQADSEE